MSVPITRDNIDEDDELFAFDILASGATVTDGKGEGSIVDGDAAVVSLKNVSRDEAFFSRPPRHHRGYPRAARE